MGSVKYDRIYQDLREKIESRVYPFQQFLPSEHQLVAIYDCSRNTVRRAIAALISEGYVQALHGKGVQVLYQPRPKSQYALGRIESFQEASVRNGQQVHTQVVHFEELTVDARLAEELPFPVGTELYYLQRVRTMGGLSLIIDHNYFRCDVAVGLTPEIAQGSIYAYLEEQLHVSIVTTMRMVTVERVTPLDEQYLDLGDMNCVAVVSNSTFNADGVLFEYTRSRHRPDHFVFYDQAQRGNTPR